MKFTEQLENLFSIWILINDHICYKDPLTIANCDFKIYFIFVYHQRNF